MTNIIFILQLETNNEFGHLYGSKNVSSKDKKQNLLALLQGNLNNFFCVDKILLK